MIRFGVGIAIAGTLPSIETMGKWAREVENGEAHSLWCAEDYYYREGFSQMTYLASVTKRVQIGLGVTNPYTRNAALLAMSIATVDEISNGRAILGIGCSNRIWIDRQMGIPFKHPLETVREYVAAIRKIVTGTVITYQGKFANLNDVKLVFEPYRHDIPVFIGAVGPKMLKLAGAIGDGVLLTTGCSPKYVKDAVKHIKEGAKEAKKSSSPEVAEYLLFSLSGDPKSVKRAVGLPVAMSFKSVEFGDRLLRSNGFNPATFNPVRDAFNRRDFKAAVDLLPNEIIENSTITGNHDQCVEKLKAHLDAGTTHPILCLMDGQVKDVLEVVKSL